MVLYPKVYLFIVIILVKAAMEELKHEDTNVRVCYMVQYFMEHSKFLRRKCPNKSKIKRE